MTDPLTEILANDRRAICIWIFGNHYYYKELGNLTNLTELNIGQNNLSGALPKSLTMLTKLTKFYFGGAGGLCAPADAAFQAWLEGIAQTSGSNCSE